MRATYTPRPGSAAERAISHLRTLAPRTELSSAALAEAIGVAPAGLATSMAPAVEHGAIHRRAKGGHLRSPTFWSLHDHDAASSAAPPPPPPARQNGAQPDDSWPIQRTVPANEAPPLPIVAPLFPPLANEDEPPALISEFVAKPAPAAAPAADLPLRIALWSDGSLELRRGSSLMTLLMPDETRALVRYLERLAVAEEAGA